MKNSALEKHIDSLRAGDMRAFDAVYEQTNRPVYFAILYIVRDKMCAEDILQVFLEGVFTDAEGLGDLVVVAVLEDLFGDLKFSGSEMVVGFQVA